MINLMLLRLVRTLPKARRWAIEMATAHAGRSRSLSACAFDRLGDSVGSEILNRVRLVVVPRVPRPPYEEWGLKAVDDLAGFEAGGIALLRTIFIAEDQPFSESMVFHELVHVLQWETLGVNRFLAMYGLQLLEHGYSKSPLETMAYDLQRQFDQGDCSFDLAPIVARRTHEELAKFARQSIAHRAACLMLALAPGRI
jgi:hypothetical protein